MSTWKKGQIEEDQCTRGTKCPSHPKGARDKSKRGEQ
jgi:hypothetical protein